MEQIIGESDIIKSAKLLFYKSKFKECISYIEEIDIGLSFEDHSILQMYRGFCFYCYTQYDESFRCFEKIVAERYEERAKRRNQIDEIDVVIRAQYQLVVLNHCIQKAEELNEKLLQDTSEYKNQHQNEEDYDEGIYLFGMGTYLLVETIRGEEIDPLVFKYLKQAYNICKKYEQEILYILSIASSYCKDQKQQDESWSQLLYELNLDYPGAAQVYGEFLLNSGQFESAEQILLYAVELCDYDPGFYLSLATLYRDQNKDEKEKEYMDKMFALTPKTSTIYQKFGQYLMRKDKIELGVEYLMKAIDLDPYCVAIYEELITYEKNNNPERAMKYCQIWIDLYPNDGFSHYHLALIILERLQIQTDNHFIIIKLVVDHLLKSIKLKNYADIKRFNEFLLASLYHRIGENINALRQYFDYCGYKSSKKQNNNLYQTSIQRVSQICLTFQNQERTIMNTICDQSGIVVERFQEFAEEQNLTHNYKQAFLNQLENLRTSFAIILYQKHISAQLAFKSSIQFWDLYIE